MTGPSAVALASRAPRRVLQGAAMADGTARGSGSLVRRSLGDIEVVHLEGAHRESSAPLAQALLRAALACDPRALMVDLTAASTVAPAVLRVIEAARQARPDVIVGIAYDAGSAVSRMVDDAYPHAEHLNVLAPDGGCLDPAQPANEPAARSAAAGSDGDAILEAWCEACGYGIRASRSPARCPMCGEASWRAHRGRGSPVSAA